ncbi:MAG: hypothetical protein H6709_15755 [Kofleriaceae bacterium]|nr:hypothetical protein [Kofleriaceae bacterium]
MTTPATPPAAAGGTGEPGKLRDLDRDAAERAVAALRDVLGRTGPDPHLQLAIAELEAIYDPASALAGYRALAAAFPQLLPARVAAARLALAADDAAAVRAELTALAGAGGTLDWAFDGAWRCGHCGFRGKAFFWRCGQCRRWGSARLDVGRDAQLPVRVHAPRERREVPRVPVHQTLLGAAATEALPEPTLEHGLSDDELARLGARPSVLGRMGGWFSGAWSGMRGKRRS